MIVSGIPRLIRVELGLSCAATASPETGGVDGIRAAGREDDTVGLLVRRLWIRVFFCRLVPAPVVESEAVTVCDEMAASAGAVINAEDADGRTAKQLWTI